eukprot:TRINITY_DN15429_c0_g1_i1.p1 TRINITY_DN15429_c0_g1~~TRINITY_DN15429_c0_g1_i1.p1  ORF type:complete len:335 (+),score=123.68 TRINITY_DN15429_c0_g1_i1:86-1090(+)
MTLHLGSGTQFAPPCGDKDTYSEQTRLYPLNVLKFRARLDTEDGHEIHREFSGAYFPRFRSLYVNEIKDAQRLGVKSVRLIPYVPEDVYLTEGNDYFYTDDFQIGRKLALRNGVGSKDRATLKALVLTDVDREGLSYHTDGGGRPAEDVPRVGVSWSKAEMMGLGRLFAKGDAGVRKMRPEELVRALEARGLLTAELQQAVGVMDKDGDGMISYDEFLGFVRGPMSEMRRSCVAAAFKRIDYNKDGLLEVGDLRQFYCCKYHPKVLNGEATEAEMLARFLRPFDTNNDGTVTYAEFCDYYSGVSAKTEDDDEFVFMMERAFNLDNRNHTKTPFR